MRTLTPIPPYACFIGSFLLGVLAYSAYQGLRQGQMSVPLELMFGVGTTISLFLLGAGISGMRDRRKAYLAKAATITSRPPRRHLRAVPTDDRRGGCSHH